MAKINSTIILATWSAIILSPGALDRTAKLIPEGAAAELQSIIGHREKHRMPAMGALCREGYGPPECSTQYK